MEKNELNNGLREQRYKFKEGFVVDVMSRIRKESGETVNYFIYRWQPIIAWSAAACIVLAITITLLSSGGLSADAFMGMSDYTELELTELLAGN